MSGNICLVVTAYGKGKTIDRIAVSCFEGSDYSSDSNANFYCDTINSLESKGDSWIYAKKIKKNRQYSIDYFYPLYFSEIILKLDDMSIQKVLRGFTHEEIIKALKSEKEEVREKIFKNVSARASQIMREDSEYMGPIRKSDIEECQKKMMSVIRHLHDTQEIKIPFGKGEPVE